MGRLLLQLVFIGMAMVAEILGSRMLFSHLPEVVAPPIHHYMSIFCGLSNNDTPMFYSGQTSALDDQDSAAVEKTDTDVISVKSLIVTRNGGEKIAHMSQYTYGPELYIDNPNVEVAGNMSQEAYMYIDWKEPTKDLAGSYACEVTAMGEDGKDVVFRKTLGIAFKEPDLDDVIEEIAWMHFELDRRPIPRTQVGTGVCGNSKNWAAGPSDSTLPNMRFSTVEGTFETPFTEAPIFSVNVKGVESLASSALRVKVNVRSVTRSGFEVDCVTWSGSSVEQLEFEWVAFTQTIFGRFKSLF